MAATAVSNNVNIHVQYDPDVEIAAGGQGTVHYALYKGLPCVLKRVVDPEYSLNEYEAIRACNNHAHVVMWHNMHMNPNRRGQDAVCLSMTMELAYCDLLHLLRASPDRGLHNSVLVKEWMYQASTALAYMHANGVVHRDIKPENILLCSRGPCGRPAALNEDGTLPHDFQVHDGVRKVTRTQSLAQCTLYHAQQDASISDTDAASVLRHVKASHKQYAAAMIQDVLREPNERCPHRPIAKLCDFGMSQVVPAEKFPPRGYSPKGSMRYAAPEVYRCHILHADRAYDAFWGEETRVKELRAPTAYLTTPTDVWSYGVLLYTVFCGTMPFRSASVQDSNFRAYARWADASNLNERVCVPHHELWTEVNPPLWGWPRDMPDTLVHLIWSCMRIRPQDRISMQDVKTHPHFVGGDVIFPQGVDPTQRWDE